MAYQTIVSDEKPSLHYSLADWNKRSRFLNDRAVDLCDDAFTIRHASQVVRNETSVECECANYETNKKLIERITELRWWREAIEKAFHRIEREMKLLMEEKFSTERELEAIRLALSTINECLTMRDGRAGIELTRDEADTEIRNELVILENNQRLLADQCKQAWEKACHLEKVNGKLNMEIDNKINAEEIDMAQLSLQKHDSNNTYKPDPTGNPKNFCNFDTWLEHTKEIKQIAENELAATCAMREALFVARERARNLLFCQQERTEHSIRKRLFETQKARNAMQWQETKLKDEMERALCEIKVLEQSLRDKTDSLKLTESRLINRAQRFGRELCLDEAHDHLCLEVEVLRKARARIMKTIDDCKGNYNLMEQHRRQITVDLANKQQSLVVDLKALDMRNRLKGGEFGDKFNSNNDTDRNMLLTRMEEKIPPTRQC